LIVILPFVCSNVCRSINSTCDSELCSHKHQECCADGLICHQGKCIVNTLGYPCNSTLDCAGETNGGGMECNNGTCFGLFLPNDQCGESMYALCVTNSTCENGFCSSINEGYPCNKESQTCGPGLYCGFDGLCQKRIEYGLSTNNPFSCKEGSVYSYGKCIMYYSLQKGENCDEESYLCAPHTECNHYTNECKQKDEITYCEDEQYDLFNCILNANCGVYQNNYFHHKSLLYLYNFNNTCAKSRCGTLLRRLLMCKCKQSFLIQYKKSECVYYPVKCEKEPYSVHPYKLLLIMSSTTIGCLILTSIGIHIIKNSDRSFQYMKITDIDVD